MIAHPFGGSIRIHKSTELLEQIHDFHLDKTGSPAHSSAAERVVCEVVSLFSSSPGDGTAKIFAENDRPPSGTPIHLFGIKIELKIKAELDIEKAFCYYLLDIKIDQSGLYYWLAEKDFPI